MESDEESLGSWAEAPDLDEVLRPLSQEIEDWCDARPDPSTLGIGATYDELVCLDNKEQSLLTDTASDDNLYHRFPWVDRTALRDGRRQAIVRAFETRRQLLRSRALESSRYGLRPLKVTSLPSDVLRIVFSDFQEDFVANAGRLLRNVDWHGYFRLEESRRRRQTVCNLRLVCRLFRDLASPLMYPMLRVQLSQSFLDFVDKISKIPAIASGVRGIRISLGYRPRAYADNIARYTNVRLAYLKEREQRYAYEHDPYYTEDLDDDDERDSEDERQLELRQALKNYAQLEAEWNAYVDAVSRGEVKPDCQLSEEQEILRTGYAEFRRLSEEQHRLLQDGTFATALASAVARMPNARSFNFVDDWDPNGTTHGGTDLFNDVGVLSKFLAAPLTWHEIEIQNQKENDEVPVRLECARLLWEVPIALHRAGVTITEIELNNLPQFSDFSVLCAQDRNGVSLWSELGAACEKLEVLDVALADIKGIRLRDLQDTDKAHLDNFLGAVLSRCSPCLRVLRLNFYGFCTTVETDRGQRDGSYPADPFIARLQELPRIRWLDLERVDLRQKTLDTLCKNLSDKLEELSLLEIKLLDGTWADSLDILRTKVAPAVARYRASTGSWYRRVDLSELQGGEFGAGRQYVASSPSESGHYQPAIIYERLLETQAGKYVKGELEHNPLRNRDV
jgi:hypothetical protein